MKIKLYTTLLTLVLSFIGSFALVDSVNAASNYSIVSNSVYLNDRSMSASDIQTFLVNRGSYLAAYKDKGPNETKKELASYLIWHAATIWGINPQVIIATLQKEQSLITNPGPPQWALDSAMGYGCPDGADCNAYYKGFANQVNTATYQLRYNYEALKGNSSFVDIDGDVHGVGQFACKQADGNHNPPFYNAPLLPGNTVTFGRNTAISGTKNTTIKIANEATASLFCYTPHIGPYGTTGYSGSDNFISSFEQWFGSRNYVVKGSIGQLYDSMDGISVLGVALNNEVKDSSGFYWQRFENGYIAGQSNSGYYFIKGAIGQYYDSHSGPKKLGKPVAGEVKSASGVWSQVFSNSIIAGKSGSYYAILDGIRDAYKNTGGINTYGQPLGESSTDSQGLTTQEFANSFIIGTKKTGYFPSSGNIRDYWLDSNHRSLLGNPVSDIKSINSATYQLYQNGGILKNGSNLYTLKGAIGALYLSNLTKYSELLGMPTGNEIHDGNYFIQNFEKGVITGSSGKYFAMINSVYNTWNNHTAQTILGAPSTNSFAYKDGFYQYFNGGVIAGDSTTGYFTLRGSIGDKLKSNTVQLFDKLGLPVENQKSTGGIYAQKFADGYIYGASGKYFATVSGIYDRWKNIGSASSKIGTPTRDSSIINGLDYQLFQHGAILGTTDDGYMEIKGSIGKTYLDNLSIYSKDLGAPLSHEVKKPYGYEQAFKNGYIVGINGKYYESFGAIYDYWQGLGAGGGKMGMPVDNILGTRGGTLWQHFGGGVLILNPHTNEVWESRGSIRAAWAKTGYQHGPLGYPIGPEVRSGGKYTQQYEHGYIESTSGVSRTVIN